MSKNESKPHFKYIFYFFLVGIIFIYIFKLYVSYTLSSNSGVNFPSIVFIAIDSLLNYLLLVPTLFSYINIKDLKQILDTSEKDLIAKSKQLIHYKNIILVCMSEAKPPKLLLVVIPVVFFIAELMLCYFQAPDSIINFVTFIPGAIATAYCFYLREINTYLSKSVEKTKSQ